MASEWGLLPWGKGEALQAVKTCFEAWLALRGGSGAAEDAASHSVHLRLAGTRSRQRRV